MCAVENEDLVEYEYAIGVLACIVVQTQLLVVEGVVAEVATVSFRNEQKKYRNYIGNLWNILNGHLPVALVMVRSKYSYDLK